MNMENKVIPNLSQIYSSPLVQYGAAAILAIAILGTMFLFGYQTLLSKPIPGWEETFLVAAMTLSANVLGYHQGATQTALAATNVAKEVAKNGSTQGSTHYS